MRPSTGGRERLCVWTPESDRAGGFLTGRNQRKRPRKKAACGNFFTVQGVAERVTVLLWLRPLGLRRSWGSRRFSGGPGGSGPRGRWHSRLSVVKIHNGFG